MNIRIKGDIVKQLNNIYSVAFKIRYKNELRQRTIDFYNSLFKGSFVELLEFSKEYCIVEENEIRVLNENFVNKYKIELFNSFNPLWYSNRKKKEIKINEEEIGLETAKKIISDYIDNFEIDKGGAIQKCKSLFYLSTDNNVLFSVDLDSCIYNKVKEEIVFIPGEKEEFLSISNIFEYNEKKVKKNNEKTKEYLKKIKRTLEKQRKRFKTFSIRLYLKDKSLFGTKWYFENIDKKTAITNYEEYYVFVNEKKEEYYIDENHKKINKECIPDFSLENDISNLKRKRDLLEFLIRAIDFELDIQ